MPREYVLQPFRPEVDLRIDYAKELNAQQLAAVTAPPGPSLVIAGAGAGKTRTLTYRVAYLLEQGIPADRILLLTFTNKAAREMMRRVSDLLGGEQADLWGGTFHSIGHRVLRRHAEAVGYRKDFTILDREDANDLLKACVAEAAIDPAATRFPKADVLGNIFSLAVNTSLGISEVLALHYDYFSHLAQPIGALANRYAQRKRASNVMDFDDLLVLWLQLLSQEAQVRDQFQRRFQFVLVDEYQDTNKIQGDLVDLLAERHQNLMVVGDDSQSIYSWRGANFRNILEFPRRYPRAAVYKIEANYRSTPEILTVANEAIRANPRQFPKTLTPQRRSGIKPALVACHDAATQAVFVAQRMLELRDEGVALRRMAVLYRSHFHALEVQLELTRRNIPFSITSGIRFFEQAHIKDVAAHLKLVCNPRDEMAFKRIVRLLPGIGGKGAAKLWGKFREAFDARPPGPHEPRSTSPRGRPGDDIQERVPQTRAPQPGDAPARRAATKAATVAGAEPGGTLSRAEAASCPLAAAFQACAPAVPKKAVLAWTQLVITLSQLERPPVRHQPSAMIHAVLEAGYEEYLRENYTNAESRLEDVTQLAAFASQFSAVEEFLAQVALLTNVEAEEEQMAARDDERVRLSTIHQAKGLEFDVVFVIMLCEGLFPHARSLERPESEEEERRLFYVAITRARNELYLSYPHLRLLGSHGGEVPQQPSRFLREIPRDLLEEWTLQARAWGG
ncbi:MAG: ATP-dependent helicase [Verrucomicrobia bacterium]|nr:ATP-dependent helicase [Verrucomicrobiota bacterium]